MAERRMFSKKIVDSDAFLEMPQSTQLLYFHLSMHADDDGFVNSPKRIMRDVGCKDDDLKLLVAKKFIIPFESGVVVIKHWLIHNYIQKDRYNPTTYVAEKSMLLIDENKAYTTQKNDSIQDVYKTDTQVSIDKDSIELGKISIGEYNAHAREDFIETEQVRELAKKHCPLISKRFEDKININGNMSALSELQKLIDIIGRPLTDYEQLFRHADQTYHSKPKYSKCDLLWLLNNWREVEQTEETESMENDSEPKMSNAIKEIFRRTLP